MRIEALLAACADHILHALGVASRSDESVERWGGLSGARLVLGMVLHRHVEGMLRGPELDDIHALLLLVLPGEHEALCLEALLVRDVELVAVPVPLHHALRPAVQ